MVLLPTLANVNIESLFSRFKFTIGMVLLCVYTYIYTSDLSGAVDPDVLRRVGFSYQSFTNHKWFILLTSNFVHFDLQHLIINLIFMTVFTGFLELYCGTVLAATVFLVGMQANIPLGVVLLPVLSYAAPAMLSSTVSFVDIGASLGVMATFGGCTWVLRRRLGQILYALVTIGFFAYSIGLHELVGLNHAVAVWFGRLAAAIYFRRNANQADFEAVRDKYFNIEALPRRRRSDAMQAKEVA